MSAEVTTERFLELVEKSRLVENAALGRIKAKLHEKYGEKLPEDPIRIANAMKKEGLITAWHIEKLLKGKYKGFFLGKYKLLGHIGSGGMSSVYLAEHTRMHDKRAIKVLPRARVKDSTYLARFQLEAQAIASLNHPNIVSAFDIDNEGDTHYIVMEYVDGVDLQQLVKRDGPLDPAHAALLLAQAADGLSHAHQRGVIHRDVKPANLLLDNDGRVRLLDMGLALVAAQEDQSLTVAHNENVLGTADYLAPEQALNSHKVDLRADIYGLGCTLYYLITGKPPFPEGTLAQRIAKHQTEMPRPMRELRSDCPGELEGLCVKMVQKQPAFRYQSAAEVAEVLRKFAASVPAGSVRKVKAGAGDSASDSHLGSSASGMSTGHVSHETVNAQSDKTLAGDRQSLIPGSGLSASDSGKLVAMKPIGCLSDLIGGSFLDLEIESGYRKPGEGSAPRRGPSSASSDVLSGASSLGSRGGSASRSGTQGTRSSKPSGAPTSGLSPSMIIVISILFVVAIMIGYILARLTT